MKKCLLTFLVVSICLLAVGCGNVTPPVEEHIYNVTDYEGEGFAAIQNAIDDCEEGGTVFIPAGTYNIFSTIMLKPNITIKGEGEATILLADGSLLDMLGDFSLMQSSHPADVSNHIEQNIVIEGITFDGNLIDERQGNLLDLSYAENVTLKNCVFKNNRRIALSLGACKNVTVNYCTFDNNGIPAPQPISTPAIWADKIGDLVAEQIYVYDCLFQNNNWSGCYFMPQVGEISRCRFINNHESAVFTTGNGAHLKFTDNYILSQRCSNISATGLEIGSCDVVIEGNFIKDCDQYGITFTNCNTAVVRNNMILNNGHQFPCAGIFVFALYDPEVGRYGTPVSNILIENNTIGNVQSAAATQNACLGFWKQEGQDPIKDYVARNNVFGECEDGELRCVGNDATNTFANEADKERITKENSCNNVITDEMEQEFLAKLDERVKTARKQEQ